VGVGAAPEVPEVMGREVDAGLCLGESLHGMSYINPSAGEICSRW
jgi:hypothetical protein